MSMTPSRQLAHSPIVEAVVDIDCDLPPDFNLGAIEERARDRFADQYGGGFRRRFRQRQPGWHSKTSEPFDIRAATYALQFESKDRPQLVQIRLNGLSFNRFAPYTILDDYLPEIQRAWLTFVDLVSPIEVQHIRLRFINRLLLPFGGSTTVDLSEYIVLGPKLPDELSLELTSVLNQYTAVDAETGQEARVRIVVEGYEQPQPPRLSERPPLPVILDIAGSRRVLAEPRVWENIEATIRSLRRMVNEIFWSTVTERCLDLFR